MVEDEVILTIRLSSYVDVCTVVNVHDVVDDVHVLGSIS